MSNEFKRTLEVNVNTNVNTTKIKEAEKIISGFFDKYDGESLKIGLDTKKAKVDVADFSKMILKAKELAEEINLVSKNSPSMLPSIKADIDYFEQIKSELASVFALLNDGNTARGFEAVMSKITDGFAITAVDIGERVEYLKNQISSVIKELNNIGAVKTGWRGQTVGYDNDDMSERQLQSRIELIKELVEWQKELESFDNKKFTNTDAPTGLSTESLKYQASSLQDTLDELKEYNSQIEEQYRITTQQLKRRQELIYRANEYSEWDSDSQEQAKRNIKDEEYYNDSIERLKSYINDRESLIKQLEATESELFRTDGIEQYVAKANAQILEYKGFIDELENFKLNDNQGTNGINLSGIAKQLEEIRDAINGIKTAFEPLTKALASEDNAMHKMLTSSVEDLDAFKAKLTEVYQMIDTLSNKQFNVTNVMSTGSSTQNDLDQIRQFRKEARELFKQVEELYAEHTETANKLKGTAGGFDAILNFSAMMGDFDMSDLAKRIKSRSAASLGIVIDELNEWKKVLLQFNSLRNNVEAGSFNVSKYSDTSSKVSIGSKTTDKDNKNIVDDRTVDDNDILNKIKSLSEQVEVELTSIREKIKETFNFDTLDLNIEKVKSMTDLIYQQFVELQSKINALNLNIDIPAISTGVKTDEKNIDVASDAMKEEGKSADEAVPKKNAFTQANKEAAQSAKETEAATKSAAEGIAAEAKAIEKSAGAVVKANDTFDKIKYINDADGNRVSKTTTSTTTKANAVETKSQYYTYKDGDPVLETETIVKDFKKRADELKKEADKIELAKKTVNKFLSQFDSKTAGQGGNIKGYDTLVNFEIKNLDDIETAMQKMIDLDAEYNKITKSFRQGTKSMNPFVNAITGIDEMGDKIKEAEIAFNGLNKKPQDLSGNMDKLRPLLDEINSFIAKDENGNKVITDIYGLADAYGQLNVVLRQVNSQIKIQKKIESADAKKTNFGLDLERQTSLLVKQQTQWQKNGQLTDELRQKINDMFDSLANVTNASELTAWKKQWAIVKDEVAATKYEIDAAKNAQGSIDTAATKQEAADAEHLISLYKEYTSAALKLKKMQSDTTGKVHDNETSTEIQNVQKAKQVLLDLGIDVNKIAGSELLTENQINALLEERINYKKKLKQFEDQAADKTATRAQKEQQKQDRQNQNYGKTIYNRESRYSETINAKASALGDNISPELSQKIQQYQEVVSQLQQLRDKFAKDPKAFDDSALKSQFQSAALEAEGLRKEILGIFNESQKLNNVDGFIGKTNLDSSQVENLKLSMMSFASEATNGKFQLEKFNVAGDEMYGTLRNGAGAIDKVTVKLDRSTNSLVAFRSGTKAVTNSWQQLSVAFTNGAKSIIRRYVGFHELLQAFRKGVGYVKEIDLAMTELKKVTNETDAAYEKFLGTASQISSKIGSTVSDFTDATAAFARLGYSMDESTKMAETAIVYKNVADGLDTVEESTDSIISTMMAYGIAADDTMSIIDRFNIVGNNFAITSAGIGEAMQRSASALKEGGNTIDESIGLITAANAVIQDPLQVGTALKTKFCLCVQKCA